jgi:hypothetical protein
LIAEQSHAHGALENAVWQWLPYSSCPVMASVRRLIFIYMNEPQAKAREN